MEENFVFIDNVNEDNNNLSLLHIWSWYCIFSFIINIYFNCYIFIYDYYQILPFRYIFIFFISFIPILISIWIKYIIYINFNRLLRNFGCFTCNYLMIYLLFIPLINIPLFLSPIISPKIDNIDIGKLQIIFIFTLLIYTVLPLYLMHFIYIFLYKSFDRNPINITDILFIISSINLFVLISSLSLSYFSIIRQILNINNLNNYYLKISLFFKRFILIFCILFPCILLDLIQFLPILFESMYYKNKLFTDNQYQYNALIMFNFVKLIFLFEIIPFNNLYRHNSIFIIYSIFMFMPFPLFPYILRLRKYWISSTFSQKSIKTMYIYVYLMGCYGLMIVSIFKKCSFDLEIILNLGFLTKCYILIIIISTICLSINICLLFQKFSGIKLTWNSL